jgi:cytidylate kinase
MEIVDEKTASWFHEIFGKWLNERLVSQAEFVHRLGKVVLLAAQHESTVFVGRGAQFILPRESGVAVRLIAPRKQRLARIMEIRGCTRHEAERFIDEMDKGRADFVKRYFHHDVADPHLYDLVINLEHTSREGAVDLILTDYRLCIERKGKSHEKKTKSNPGVVARR